MTILEFRCEDCFSVFEQLISEKNNTKEIRCIACGSANFTRAEETSFSPKKKFCPKINKKYEQSCCKKCSSEKTIDTIFKQLI